MKNRLPPWFRQEIITGAAIKRLSALSGSGVYTVCSEARCPNLNACFKESRLTFLILGDQCTRHCRFCAIKKAPAGRLGTDTDEPCRIAGEVKRLALKYVVITSVSRDDLDDAGAGQFARTIEAVKNTGRGIGIEVLIPDFSGNRDSLKKVVNAGPCVLAHNLETVKRLYPEVRPQADYRTSLDVINMVKKIRPDMVTKSSLMLGLGESEAEVVLAMKDLRGARCDVLTLGQYLSPGQAYYPVKEFLSLERFERYFDIGMDMGFKRVSAGPLIRSSYRAEEIYREAICA